MSAVAEVDLGLIERTYLGINMPTLISAVRAKLQRVIVNAPGEVSIYDACRIEEATASILIYFDSRMGLSDPLSRPCSNGIFAIPSQGAVVALHYFGVL